MLKDKAEMFDFGEDAGQMLSTGEILCIHFYSSFPKTEKKPTLEYVSKFQQRVSKIDCFSLAQGVDKMIRHK